MRRLAILVALVSLVALVTPAAAATPTRDCPAAFDGPTLISDLVSDFPEFDPVEFADFMEVIDANGDMRLCTRPFPSNSTKFGQPFFVANFIDNVAR